MTTPVSALDPAALPAGSKLFDVEGVPVAFVPTPDGGLDSIAFDGPPRRFPMTSATRNGAPFLPELLGELYAFPKATRDDQVDAMTQGIRFLTDWRGGRGILEYYRQEVAKMSASG